MDSMNTVSLNTSSIRVISSKESIDTMIDHNHVSPIMLEVGECPACDEFHKFYND